MPSMQELKNKVAAGQDEIRRQEEANAKSKALDLFLQQAKVSDTHLERWRFILSDVEKVASVVSDFPDHFRLTAFGSFGYHYTATSKPVIVANTTEGWTLSVDGVPESARDKLRRERFEELYPLPGTGTQKGWEAYVARNPYMIGDEPLSTRLWTEDGAKMTDPSVEHLRTDPHKDAGWIAALGALGRQATSEMVEAAKITCESADKPMDAKSFLQQVDKNMAGIHAKRAAEREEAWFSAFMANVNKTYEKANEALAGTLAELDEIASVVDDMPERIDAKLLSEGYWHYTDYAANIAFVRQDGMYRIHLNGDERLLNADVDADRHYRGKFEQVKAKFAEIEPDDALWRHISKYGASSVMTTYSVDSKEGMRQIAARNPYLSGELFSLLHNGMHIKSKAYWFNQNQDKGVPQHAGYVIALNEMGIEPTREAVEALKAEIAAAKPSP